MEKNKIKNELLDLLINNNIIYESDNKIRYNFESILSNNTIINKFLILINNQLKLYNIDYIIGLSCFTMHICSCLSFNNNYKLLLCRNKRIIYGNNYLNNELKNDSETNSNKICLFLDNYDEKSITKYSKILESNKINISHIFTLTDFTLNNNSEKINDHKFLNIFNFYDTINNIHFQKKYSLYIKNLNNDKFKIDHSNNKLYNKLIYIINEKQQNYCLNCITPNYTKIINNIEKYGKNICCLIINSNIINNFNTQYGLALRKLALNYNFLLINDLKISCMDQLNNNVLEWCNFITIFHFEDYNLLNKNINYLSYSKINSSKINSKINTQNYNIIGHICDDYYFSNNLMNFSKPYNNLNDIKESSNNLKNYDVYIVDSF